MHNNFIICNVETFVLHSSIDIYKQKEKVESKTCLISEMPKMALELAYANRITEIFLTGNVLYAETIRRYIREENALEYNNKKEI